MDLDSLLKIALQSAKNYSSDTNLLVAEEPEDYITNSTNTSPQCWEEIKIILTVIYNEPSLAPSSQRSNLKGRSFDKIMEEGSKLAKDYLDFWINKYYNGFEKRPSNREGKPSNTVPDPAIDVILKALNPGLSNGELKKIELDHRLSMAAENVLGDLLEEYLSKKLVKPKWCCCWGSTITSVDFCKSDGSLLQIKNRSNSENSSSNKVRKGTNIQKWHRIKAENAKTFWSDLNSKTGSSGLSEEDFLNFIRKTIELNPLLIYKK